jgi:hypothetical protein
MGSISQDGAFVVGNFGIAGMFNRIEVLAASRRQASPATLDEFLQVGHARHLAPEGFVITSAHRIASTDAQGAASLPAAG